MPGVREKMPLQETNVVSSLTMYRKSECRKSEILESQYLVLSHHIFLLVDNNYNLTLWVNFFILFGWNPKVSFLLAGITKLLVDGWKGLCLWGDGLNNYSQITEMEKIVSIQF